MIKKLGLILLSIILLDSLVHGFAISSTYYKGKPLIIYPGESKDFSIILQNGIGDEDLAVMPQIINGYGIISLSDSEEVYDVPLGSMVPVSFVVNISKNESIGNIYNLELAFNTVLKNTVSKSKSTDFVLQSSIGYIIPVVIGEKLAGEDKILGIIFFIILVVFLTIVASLIILKPKKKKKKHTK